MRPEKSARRSRAVSCTPQSQKTKPRNPVASAVPTPTRPRRCSADTVAPPLSSRIVLSAAACSCGRSASPRAANVMAANASTYSAKSGRQRLKSVRHSLRRGGAADVAAASAVAAASVAAAVAATATAADARTFTASGRRSRRNGEAMASVAGTVNRMRVTAQARERLCIECMPSCGGLGSATRNSYSTSRWIVALEPRGGIG